MALDAKLVAMNLDAHLVAMNLDAHLVAMNLDMLDAHLVAMNLDAHLVANEPTNKGTKKFEIKKKIMMLMFLMKWNVLNSMHRYAIK